MTVAELNARMDEQEYADWMALYEVESEEHRRAIKQAKEAGDR